MDLNCLQVNSPIWRNGCQRHSRSSLKNTAKWTKQEEIYIQKLISSFRLGFLNIPKGTLLRNFLSQQLKCDPMRISKHFMSSMCMNRLAYSPCEQSDENLRKIEKIKLELLECGKALTCDTLFLETNNLSQCDNLALTGVEEESTLLLDFFKTAQKRERNGNEMSSSFSSISTDGDSASDCFGAFSSNSLSASRSEEDSDTSEPDVSSTNLSWLETLKMSQSCSLGDGGLLSLPPSTRPPSRPITSLNRHRTNTIGPGKLQPPGCLNSQELAMWRMTFAEMRRQDTMSYNENSPSIPTVDGGEVVDSPTGPVFRWHEVDYMGSLTERSMPVSKVWLQSGMTGTRTFSEKKRVRTE